MKRILFAILITMAVAVELMASSPTWNTGYVILPDGRRLEGELNYNWKVEVLQVRMANGLLKAYSAGYVDHFTFYDNNQQIIRKFSSVALPGREEQLRPVFFEELATGTLTVYRRLRHVHELFKLSNPSTYGDDTELIKDIDTFDYMVINAEGRFFDMAMFNADLWPLMTIYKKQLISYIRTRNVEPSSTLARLLIINQYNFLCADQNESVAAGTNE